MNSSIKFVFGFCVISTLSACGESDVFEDPEVDFEPPEMEVEQEDQIAQAPGISQRDLGNTDSGSSQLGGAAAVGSDSDTSFEAVALTGEFFHPNGDLSLSDGQLSLARTAVTGAFDPNGDNVYTDGTTEVEFGEINVGSFAYSAPVLLEYDHNGERVTGFGVLGLTTSPPLLKTSGSATYSGGTAGVVNLGSGFFVMRSADTTLRANFGTGLVNLDVDNVVALDRFGNQIAIPFDEIRANNMAISGANFEGTHVITLNNGSRVNITGPNTITSAKGSFFGYSDSVKGPDEAGGVFSTAGDNGSIAGIFLTD